MSSNSPGSFARWRLWVCIHQVHHKGTEAGMILTSFLRRSQESGENIRPAEHHFASQEELAELCVGREDGAP